MINQNSGFDEEDFIGQESQRAARIWQARLLDG